MHKMVMIGAVLAACAAWTSSALAQDITLNRYDAHVLKEDLAGKMDALTIGKRLCNNEKWNTLRQFMCIRDFDAAITQAKASVNAVNLAMFDSMIYHEAALDTDAEKFFSNLRQLHALQAFAGPHKVDRLASELFAKYGN